MRTARYVLLVVAILLAVCAFAGFEVGGLSSIRELSLGLILAGLAIGLVE